MKKIGLTLGGGGAKGLCHIAFIKALDAVRMTGIEIENNLKKVGFIDLYELMDFSILSKPSMLKGNGVQDFHRYGEIMEEVKEDIEAFKFEMAKRLEL